MCRILPPLSGLWRGRRQVVTTTSRHQPPAQLQLQFTEQQNNNTASLIPVLSSFIPLLLMVFLIFCSEAWCAVAAAGRAAEH